jgi:hypothetical protein
MMVEEYVQWAAILSPVIAVLLAWWTSRSGARDTAKLVKCIKKMMQIQLQIKTLELSKEAKEEHIQFEIFSKKNKESHAHDSLNHLMFSPEELRRIEEQERDTDAKINSTFDRRRVIAETMSDIMKLTKEIEKI